MNLSTTYMGLQLANPLVVGASPLADEVDTARRLEDAGASAIVMRSLFEEQIEGERTASVEHLEMFADSFAEALSFFPEADEFKLGPDAYLEQIRRLKDSVDVPIIASLNGLKLSGWLKYAELIEQAGADALELNVYHIATATRETPESIEHRIREVAREVRRAVQLPLAIKLSPFFTSLPNLATELRTVGIDGLVLFNRFYQPDFDLDEIAVVPRLKLSDSSELLLRLRWLAILSGRCNMSLAASGGVHTATDVIKATMAGAHAVQIVSALLEHGPGYLKTILDDLKTWMEQHEYLSIHQMQGSLSLCAAPTPRHSSGPITCACSIAGMPAPNTAKPINRLTGLLENVMDAKGKNDCAAWLSGPPCECSLTPRGDRRDWRIILLGAPGVGKGTQAQLLSERLGLCHLSTGDLFRAAADPKTGNLTPAMGQAVSDMRSGKLVTDSTVLQVVRERSACLRCRGGFLLDGFPRTLTQAEALQALLHGEGLGLDAVLDYELPTGEIVARLSGRRVCKKCKAVFHVTQRPPRSEGICDTCGSPLIQREDDRPESVKVRLETYERETAPLIDYYRAAGKLLPISADGSPEQIVSRSLEALDASLAE